MEGREETNPHKLDRELALNHFLQSPVSSNPSNSVTEKTAMTCSYL